MERFILRQNVARFRSLLELKVGEQERCKLRVMLASARRELAVREAALSGIHLDGARLARAPLAAGRNPAARHLFQRLLEDPSHAYLVLDAGPGLQIVDVNDAFARSALVESSRVAGQPFFDVFPDNPADRQADGVSNVYAALQSAWQSGRSYTIWAQRYDIRDPEGRFIERHWRAIYTPILDEEKRMPLLLIQAVDITAETRQASRPVE